MGVSKVIINNNTIIDLTGDTVTQESLLNGYTAHDKYGDIIYGNAAPTSNGIVINYIDQQNNISELNFTGNEVSLISKTINENGIYNASDDSVTGYSVVDVNVPMPTGDIIVNANRLTFSGCSLQINTGSTFLYPNVTITDTVTDCYELFYDRVNFNGVVNIGNNVRYCTEMFRNCHSYNRVTIFPKSIVDIYYCFLHANNMYSDIFINKASGNLGIEGFLSTKPRNKSINIYCNNLALINNSNTPTIFGIGSGDVVTWTPTINGYYNASYNVYILNNYSEETGLIRDGEYIDPHTLM